MTITVHEETIQGSDEWLALRCGLLTASEMKMILTPTLKKANNEKTRQHVYEVLAQRISAYVEPRYVGDDMLRGQEDEIEAAILYNTHIAPLQTVGFVTNNKWGFTIGYSPDGLVGDDGLIEVKSRLQKYQVETIIGGVVPEEFMLQIQTGLLVTERKWCDFLSYSGGLPMPIMRVEPDAMIQSTIVDAAAEFEKTIAEKMAIYKAQLASGARYLPTKRRVEQEIRI